MNSEVPTPMSEDEKLAYAQMASKAFAESVSFIQITLNHNGSFDIVTPMTKAQILDVLMTVFEKMNTNQFNRL